MLKQAIYYPLVFLEMLGEAVVSTAAGGTRNFIEFLLLALKLIWDKTVMFREKIVNIAKYLFVFVASPFVKMSISYQNMKRDMKREAQEGGGIRVAFAFFPYFGKFLFGRRGFFVTTFNYAAPILSLIFLLNVVSYATSANFMLRLVINGEFYGYIESEQVFLDAESSVMQRINYIGSEQSIELIPEFSIANIGTNQTMTANQVANRILERSDFNLERAHGFFVDGVLRGAILDEDLPAVRNAVQEYLASHANNTGEEQEEDSVFYDVVVIEETVEFLNHVVWEGFDLFLQESVVEPQVIIALLNSTLANGQPYLPVVVTRVVEYTANVPFQTIRRFNDSENINWSETTQRGVEGSNRHVARISRVAGEEQAIRRNILQTTIITEPTPQITYRGTRPLSIGNRPAVSRDYGRFTWPVVRRDNTPVTSFSRSLTRYHSGTDFPAPSGTPIVAADNGVVESVLFSNGSLGHTVIILHDDGMRTLYAHASAIYVRQGQRVTRGDEIAGVGTTGRSTGNHLHFEVWEAGTNRRLEPLHFLPR
jgi:murein DD-endopeptidase MepM/ murein hydrolase activator NlpD